MGWLNTLLDATTVVIGMSNAAKLRAMEQQGAAAAMVDEVVTLLRNQIFTCRQLAESILAQEERMPKIAAGAMCVLEAKFRASGLTHELFNELADKDYCVATTKLIQNNASRMLYRLSPSQRDETIKTVDAALKLEHYRYYTDHYDQGVQLIEAAKVVDKYHRWNNCLVYSFFIGFLGLGLLALMGGLSAMAMSGGAGVYSSNAGVGGLFFVSGIVLIALGIILMGRMRLPNIYPKAKSAMTELEKQVDLEIFRPLHQRFGTFDEVRELRDQAEATVQSFFGESNLLNP